jgi:lysyl-tRNA synthetase class 2
MYQSATDKIFNNNFVQERLKKVQDLKELNNGIAFRNDLHRTCTSSEFLKRFDYVKNSENRRDESEYCSLFGRVKFLRKMGKAWFLKIEDSAGIIQVYMNRDSLPENAFANIKKIIEAGDILFVKGYPFVTKTGELSIHAFQVEIMTKSISPLPEKFHGLKDKELRYRQRYLDLIMNSDVKKTFEVRSKIVSYLRHFFEEKGFLEVETPMLHPIAGGANARPFITHHNALGVERYLRIAPELYLKRLIVGGFDAVFEINRNFRNEGMDHTHNPEFTMLEFYWAYKNYHHLISFTEEFFDYIFEKLQLEKVLDYGDMKINFQTPFRKISYRNSIIEIGKVPESVLESRETIMAFLDQNKIDYNKNATIGYLMAELFDNFVEDKLIDPTFITEFPIDISPLARRSNEDSEIADRFELFIAKTEISNAFSELNDPVDQYNRFKKQLEAKEGGDDEAHEMDEDYINALMYGMPPTAGQGIGIDRLVMLLTNQESIRDVLLFPAMKPLHNQNEENKKEQE